MPFSAPQRQRLPLIRSASSARVGRAGRVLGAVHVRGVGVGLLLLLDRGGGRDLRERRGGGGGSVLGWVGGGALLLVLLAGGAAAEVRGLR